MAICITTSDANGMTTTIEVPIRDEPVDYGTCDYCDGPLDAHCSSCDFIFCEACEFGS